MATLEPIRITWRLPWWMKPYFHAMKFFNDLGVLDVNPDSAIAFVQRHTKFYMVLSDGKLRRI